MHSTRLQFNTASRLAGTLCATLVLSCVYSSSVRSGESPGLTPVEEHRQTVLAWRADRHERLVSETGWLTLVGLEWLQKGENRIGGAEDNHIRIPGGPDYWGTVVLEDGQLRFLRAPGEAVSVDGAFPEEVLLVADKEGKPTTVKSGSLSFHPIFRQSYALRIKDTQAPTRLSFTGVDQYEIDMDWRFEGTIHRAEEDQTIEIGNVLGQLNDSPLYGVFEFEHAGETYRLFAIGDDESKSLWFIFADRTNGRGSYGAGRFLYSDGMPQDGRLVVDFNKSYNPPCAFSEYSTCPLPPQANRLDLAVTAGEKNFHP
jgi:uncharacterized protein (DUF1684 family)